jgi:hypothetical protein
MMMTTTTTAIMTTTTMTLMVVMFTAREQTMVWTKRICLVSRNCRQSFSASRS